MSQRDISILVVDDAKFSSAVVGRSLKAAGYTDIRHASSASAALALMEQRQISQLVIIGSGETASGSEREDGPTILHLQRLLRAQVA